MVAETTARDAFGTRVQYAKQLPAGSPGAPSRPRRARRRTSSGPARDGPDARLRVAASPGLFFREACAQCKGRVEAACAYDVPTVVVHGSVTTDQFVRTARGARLAAPGEQDDLSLRALDDATCAPKNPESGPYCVDVVSALVSIEIARRQGMYEPAPSREAMRDFAPQFLLGYLRGLGQTKAEFTTLGEARAGELDFPFADGLEPALSPGAPAPFHEPLPASEATGKYALQHSSRCAEMRKATLDADDAVVNAVQKAWNATEGACVVVEAGRLPGSRTLVALAFDGAPPASRAFPSRERPRRPGARIWPARRRCRASSGAWRFAAVELETFQRFEAPVADKKAAGKLALWLGAALGISTPAGADVDAPPRRRRPLRRVDRARVRHRAEVTIAGGCAAAAALL
ncbi:hypothetical protein JL722_14046 [Aureococcus anophagefferens]|nr:hypothetical protein JL722_14046 [Aureococcus anophagefferens]